MTFKFVKLDMIFTTFELCMMPTMCISFRSGRGFSVDGSWTIVILFIFPSGSSSPVTSSLPPPYYLSPFPPQELHGRLTYIHRVN